MTDIGLCGNSNCNMFRAAYGQANTIRIGMDGCLQGAQGAPRDQTWSYYDYVFWVAGGYGLRIDLRVGWSSVCGKSPGYMPDSIQYSKWSDFVYDAVGHAVYYSQVYYGIAREIYVEPLNEPNVKVFWCSARPGSGIANTTTCEDGAVNPNPNIYAELYHWAADGFRRAEAAWGANLGRISTGGLGKPERGCPGPESVWWNTPYWNNPDFWAQKDAMCGKDFIKRVRNRLCESGWYGDLELVGQHVYPDPQVRLDQGPALTAAQAQIDAVYNVDPVCTNAGGVYSPQKVFITEGGYASGSPAGDGTYYYWQGGQCKRLVDLYHEAANSTKVAGLLVYRLHDDPSSTGTVNASPYFYSMGALTAPTGDPATSYQPKTAYWALYQLFSTGTQSQC